MLLSGRGLIPLTRATYRHIVTPATLALGIIDASGSFVTTTVRLDPYNRHSRYHLTRQQLRTPVQPTWKFNRESASHDAGHSVWQDPPAAWFSTGRSSQLTSFRFDTGMKEQGIRRKRKPSVSYFRFLGGDDFKEIRVLCGLQRIARFLRRFRSARSDTFSTHRVQRRFKRRLLARKTMVFR
jgi:hypothetical protein